MKKIIIGIFSFAMLLMAQNVSAAVWNGASNDCAGISVANYTTNTGIVVPCWPLSTVSANGGQVVNIRIYYHNTNTQSNTNTRVLLNAPTGASSSHSFSGQIISDQGSISLGSIRVNTPSGTTLNFSGAHWLPNQRQTESSLLSGQTGAEILTGGLNIGTIAPGWDTQGSVVVVFNVTGPETPPATVPTGTLTPNKTSCAISSGANSCEINFSWNTNNPNGISAVTRDGGANVATGNSGTKAFTVPYNTATFRLYNSAIELDSETVTSYCTTGTSWNGTVCSPNLNPNYACSITSFTAGGSLSTTVTSGNGVELAWTTDGCNSVSINSVGTNLDTNGSYTVYPTVSTTYKITGFGSIGTYPTRTVSVTVNPVSNPKYACSITSFTANGSQHITVREDRSVEIYWNTSNCTSINIPGVGYNLDASGHYSVNPSRDTRYTITASGSLGSSQTKYVEVEVLRNVTPSYTCSIENFSVNDSHITAGDSTRIYWDTENCRNVNISNVGNVNTSGSVNISPAVSTNYILTAYGSNSGTQTRSVFVTVDQYRPTPIIPVAPIVPVYVNKSVVTTVATNITQTEAQVNGYITSGNFYNSSTYFEYGTTVNLGLRTASKGTISNTSMNDVLRGLTPNTIYFFRAVGESVDGVSKGSIEIFKTLGDTTVKQIIVQGTTVVGTASPVMLNISNKYEIIGNGDLVDYVVTYKNIGKTKLLRPMVQVVLPSNFTLVNASRGSYSVDTHTLSALIEDLEKGQEGVIFLQARVDSIPENNAQIVTTAILVYTNTNGAQENVMAYALNVPRLMMVVGTTNDLGASAFFAGLLSIGLIGWLLIILVILLLIFIVRSVYSRDSGPQNIHTPTH